MTYYRVDTISLSSSGKRVLQHLDVVTEKDLVKGSIPKLLKDKAICVCDKDGKEVKEKAPAKEEKAEAKAPAKKAEAKAPAKKAEKKAAKAAK